MERVQGKNFISSCEPTFATTSGVLDPVLGTADTPAVTLSFSQATKETDKSVRILSVLKPK